MRSVLQQYKNYLCSENPMKDDRKKTSSKKILLIILIEALLIIAAVMIINLLIPLDKNPLNSLREFKLDHKEAAVNIPNITVDDLIAYLEQDYACQQREKQNNLYSWQCVYTMDKTSYEVLIFSRDDSSIDLIDANIVQDQNPDDQLAVEYLCKIAAIPFDFEPQEESCDWIRNALPNITQIGDLHEKEFNGIRHLLYGTAEARSLELGKLP